MLRVYWNALALCIVYKHESSLYPPAHLQKYREKLLSGCKIVYKNERRYTHSFCLELRLERFLGKSAP